jgi:hypothetical protein
MPTIEDYAYTYRVKLVDEGVCNLIGETFLHLKSARVDIDQPAEF